MSQITRCPVCSTQFKIQPKQLKISEGWVRCGKCNEIFDASEHFVDAPAIASPQADSYHAGAGADSAETAAAPDQASSSRKQSLEDLIARVQRRLDNALAGNTSTSTATATADLEARLRASQANDPALADTVFSPPPDEVFAPATSAEAPAAIATPTAAPATPPAPLPPAPATPVQRTGEELRVTDKWQQDLSYTFAPSRPGDLSELDDLARATHASHGGDRVEVFEPALKSPATSFQSEVENWRNQNTHAGGNAPAADHSGVVSYGLHKSGDAQAISEQVAQSQAQEVQADATVDRESIYQSSHPGAGNNEQAQLGNPAPADGQDPERFGLGEPNLHANAPYAHEADNPETEGLSFVRHAQKRAFWRKKSVRLALGLLAVALGGTLALQVAVQNSQQLAARSPQMKGWMQTLCRHANCSTAPLQDIQALVIDSSSFQIVAPNTYELAWAVKNQAANWVQAPSLEINLLNSRQGVLVRRILTPAELGDVRELAPHQLWSLKQGLTVAADAGEVAGYRLQLVYP